MYHKRLVSTREFVLDESILTPVEHPKFPSDTMEYRHQIYGEDLDTWTERPWVDFESSSRAFFVLFGLVVLLALSAVLWWCW